MSDDSFGQDSTDEASLAQQRRAALRALAQNTHEAPVAAPPAASPSFAAQLAPARGPGRRIALVAVSLLLVVAVAAGVAAHLAGWPHGSASAVVKPIVRIALANDNVGCVSSVAWSPNSQYVAAIGQSGGCSMSTEQSPIGVILIYAARSGKLLKQIHPDATIFENPAVQHLINTNTTPTDMPAELMYWMFTWTPDNASLLALFNVSVQSVGTDANGVQESRSATGLLSVRVNGATPATVWVSPPFQYVQNNTLARWDLANGSVADVPQPPIATAYRWNSDDSLAPGASTANQPIGNPVGGQIFTIWQSGMLSRAAAIVAGAQGTQTLTPINDIGWSTPLSAVSPDGRYYFPNLSGYGSLVPPSTQQGASFNEPTLQPRDHALLLVAESMLQEPAQITGSQPAILVTWRPDGKLLAETKRIDGGSAPGAKGTLSVIIRNTATGQVVTTLTPKLDDLPSSSQPVESLSWSPDGSRLLLLDPIYGAITIWGPGALPK